MKPRAMIFDLDGTLIDIYRAPEQVWSRSVAEHAQNAPHIPHESLLKAIDRWRQWLWSTPERHKRWRNDLRRARREIVKLAFDELKIDNPAAARDIADRFSDLREEEACLIDGAREVVRSFRTNGVVTALMTNGEAAIQRAKVERFELGSLFDYIQIEGEAGAGKPEVAAYELMISSLSISGADTWMVGDNLEWDVGSPQRFGMTGIWYNPDHASVPVDCTITPDHTISSLGELLELADIQSR